MRDNYTSYDGPSSDDDKGVDLNDLDLDGDELDGKGSDDMVDPEDEEDDEDY